MSAGNQIAVLFGLTMVLVVAAAWIALRVHGTADKREFRRRQHVHLQGRLGDAMVTEATETTIYYSYSVRGVQYAASQDITALRERLPAAPEQLIGFASLKYSPKNPANSIVICEEWNGLRATGRAGA